MGGKIRALNEMSGYAAELARALHESGSEDVIYAVDGAYWQVVSLKAKHDLAKSYVELLESLDSNVGKMVDEGVATRSQKLQVDVKLNEARVDLTKVENGLVLSRMALAKVCGLPLNTVFYQGCVELSNTDICLLADCLVSEGLPDWRNRKTMKHRQ